MTSNHDHKCRNKRLMINVITNVTCIDQNEYEMLLMCKKLLKIKKDKKKLVDLD